MGQLRITAAEGVLGKLRALGEGMVVRRTLGMG